MTARLVAARALAGDAGPSWVTLLQSCGAYQAFLRSAQGAVDDRRSVEFLLLDPLFPRSLMSALVAPSSCLDELAAQHGATERGRGQRGAPGARHDPLGAASSRRPPSCSRTSTT